MTARFPKVTPSLMLSAGALFIALGGTGYAADYVVSADNAQHLGGQPPSYYASAKRIISSQGERFINAGHTATLGQDGHFTFMATCMQQAGGEDVVSFDVIANTTADLDGNGPMPAGTNIVIHEDSDALDATKEKELKPGEFAQVASASSSTEIASDGEEADVFYNDGVNWPASGGSRAHACFAGYNGTISG
jgi:hypothetical protein